MDKLYGIDDVAVIVVHHNSLETIFGTLHSLAEAGIAHQHITVIDNSESEEVAHTLRSKLHPEVTLVVAPNRGYGAAVNECVRRVDADQHPYVLVSTHETRPLDGCVTKLRDALVNAGDATAVVGPVLRNADNNQQWSAGGSLTRFGHPRHGQGRSRSLVEWLDGAFLMMRTDVVAAHPFDESFGLYYEELDHQLRLQALGYRVALVSEAVAEQTSSGIPSYWRARNAPKFSWRHFGVLAGIVVWAETLSRLIGKAVAHGSPDVGADALRGAFASRSMREVILINPLGGALRHYENQLRSTLLASGFQCDVRNIVEPSLTGQSRIVYLLKYCGLLLGSRFAGSSRLSGRPVIVLWPVLHYLDIPLIKLLVGRRAVLIMHDPRPLVTTRGTGPWSRRLAARLVKTWPIVVHSQVAEAHLREDVPSSALTRLRVLPLPILEPLGVTRSTAMGGVTIRALGQFKPDRDLAAMEHMGSAVPSDWALEVMGRGWPVIANWVTHDTYLSETEFDNAIATASAVVIPYSRFYQSAVATRALESGVPVCGPIDSALIELYRDLSDECLVSRPDDWAPTLQRLVVGGRSLALAVARSHRDHAVHEWSKWLMSGASNQGDVARDNVRLRQQQGG